MPIVKNPHQDLYAVVRETRTALAFAKARALDNLLVDLEHLAGEWAREPEPTPAPPLDADEARATVAAPAPEPAPEPTPAPRKVPRRAKVDAEPEAEPTPSRIRAPKAAQVALPVQDAPPAPALTPVVTIAEADGDGPF